MTLLPSDALSCQLPCKGVCRASLPLSPSHQHLPTPCQWQCFPQVTKSHIKLLLITTGPTVVTVGSGEGPATLDGHRSCPAAHPEGLPQGFTPHTPTEIWFPHKIQLPPEQLSCSCCHPEISTKNSFQQRLPGVWSHGRVVPAPPSLLQATLSRKAETS